MSSILWYEFVNCFGFFCNDVLTSFWRNFWLLFVRFLRVHKKKSWEWRGEREQDQDKSTTVPIPSRSFYNEADERNWRNKNNENLWMTGWGEGKFQKTWIWALSFNDFCWGTKIKNWIMRIFLAWMYEFYSQDTVCTMFVPLSASLWYSGVLYLWSNLFFLNWTDQDENKLVS